MSTTIQYIQLDSANSRFYNLRDIQSVLFPDAPNEFADPSWLSKQYLTSAYTEQYRRGMVLDPQLFLLPSGEKGNQVAWFVTGVFFGKLFQFFFQSEHEHLDKIFSFIDYPDQTYDNELFDKLFERVEYTPLPVR